MGAQDKDAEVAGSGKTDEENYVTTPHLRKSEAQFCAVFANVRLGCCALTCGRLGSSLIRVKRVKYHDPRWGSSTHRREVLVGLDREVLVRLG